MRSITTLLSIVLALAIPCSSQAKTDNTLRLVIPLFKPYTYNEGGNLKGIGVELVSQVMQSMGQHYTLTLAPNYGRALSDIQHNKADGFFLASQNAERDTSAVFSNPLTLNRWCWFFSNESSISSKHAGFKTGAKIGTFLHTNTHKWLVNKGYEKIKPVAKVTLLPKMLIRDRIQSIFLAEAVFEDSVKKSGLSINQFRQAVEIAKPFGIYISKEYLKHHTGFMSKLNNAITQLSNLQNLSATGLK